MYPTFENTLTFVRSIKGAPASILWAMVFTKRMMTALELAEWTGYKGDNITVAVRLLTNLGWITAQSSRGPWGLAEGRQLPLMQVFETLENPDSDLIGVRDPTTTTTIGRDEKIDGVVVVVDCTNPIKSDSWPEICYEVEGVTFEGNLKACRRANIGEPKASQIAACEWVSPVFIDAHIKSLREMDVLGLAIRRIECNEMPKVWLDDIKNIPNDASPRKKQLAKVIDADSKADELRTRRKRKTRGIRMRRVFEAHEPAEINPDRGRYW